MNEFYIYTNTHEMRGCPRFDNLDDALEEYYETQMNEFKDNVFLGIEGTLDNGERYCFDVLHKFFKENILINDYLNHPCREILGIVHGIIEKNIIKYQYTTDILGGVLIDFQSPVALIESKRTEEKWNEIYVSTLKDNELVNKGWVKPTRETFELYGWSWPKICSYISLINATVYDARGYAHDVDMDPRVYLSLINKKVSIRKGN